MVKGLILGCLLSIGSVSAYADTDEVIQAGQPFSAVFWTATNLHTPSGKPVVFMRRVVCTRDSYGVLRRAIYEPTKGYQHNLTAPLERIITSSSSTPSESPLRPNSHLIEREDKLGMLRISGLLANGERQTYVGIDGQWDHTLETWYSPSLALPVHTERHDVNGNFVISDLTELSLGSNPIPDLPIAARREVPLLVLYRGIFNLLGKMERDKLVLDSSRQVNVGEIEDTLRKTVNFSVSDWRLLVAKSVAVSNYTHDASGKAHSFAKEDLRTREVKSSVESSRIKGRAVLHEMQLELNSHILGEIDDLKRSIGPAATDRLETYLKGTFTTTASVMASTRPTPGRRDRTELTR